MRTPILVGAGQHCQRDTDSESLFSPVDLAADAARNAIADVGVDSGADLAAAIDTIAWVRTFADSTPQFPSRLGLIKNPPRSLAKRIGANPANAIHTEVGGNSPQALVNSFATSIANGEMEVGLIAGAEAIANETFAVKNGLSPDWSEDAEGQVDDRGLGLDGLATPVELLHSLLNSMPLAYSLNENAIRHQLGHSLEQHADYMARLMERFVDVAKNNPYSMLTECPAHEELISRENLLTTTYHKNFCAREKVNQAAAVMITSVEKARELEIPEEKWIYLHEGADVKANTFTARENFHTSESIQAGVDYLASKNIRMDEMSYFDIYSCFPSAVEISMQALGVDVSDSRPLTLTGGLPYFGGPGNNYSMHAIAEMVHTLRGDRKASGLVLANGGVLSKQSFGVYSAVAPDSPWAGSAYIGPQENAAPEFLDSAEGVLEIETYGVLYARGEPSNGIVIGRLQENGKRAIGLVHKDDSETFEALREDEIIGSTGNLRATPNRNFFSF